MKKLIRCIGLLCSCGMATFAGTLNVTASEAPSNGLYNYSYIFSVTGTGGGFDNIYLGSDDLSPLNVQFLLNGAATTDWTFLGNNTPQNYLQFFSLDGATLGVGSSLGISFTSSLKPTSSHFAVALNSATSAESNEVLNVLAPSMAPEPASILQIVMAAGVALVCVGVKRLG